MLLGRLQRSNRIVHDSIRGVQLVIQELRILTRPVQCSSKLSAQLFHLVEGLGLQVLKLLIVLVLDFLDLLSVFKLQLFDSVGCIILSLLEIFIHHPDGLALRRAVLSFHIHVPLELHNPPLQLRDFAGACSPGLQHGEPRERLLVAAPLRAEVFPERADLGLARRQLLPRLRLRRRRRRRRARPHHFVQRRGAGGLPSPSRSRVGRRGLGARGLGCREQRSVPLLRLRRCCGRIINAHRWRRTPGASHARRRCSGRVGSRGLRVGRRLLGSCPGDLARRCVLHTGGSVFDSVNIFSGSPCLRDPLAAYAHKLFLRHIERSGRGCGRPLDVRRAPGLRRGAGRVDVGDERRSHVHFERR